MRIPLLSSLLCSSFLACACLSPADAADAISPALKMAIADPARPPDEIARDTAAKPADAIAFAGIKPGQEVAELAPGEGYYSRILSILVGPKGHLYTLVPFTGAINADTLRKQTKGEELPADAAFAVADIRGYENILVLWEDLALDGGQFALPKQADVVWMSADYGNLDNKAYGAMVDAVAVDKAILAAMKPGATLVVPVAKTGGATSPDAAKTEITSAGFTFDAQADMGDHALLRFKKPATMTGDKRAIGTAAVKTLFGNTLLTGMGREIERHLFYHPDGTYQELGKTASLLQEGYWFIDAAGRNCILHQFPREERGYNFCMLMEPRKVGDRWDYPGRRGPEKEMLGGGFVYMDGTTVTPMKP